MSAPLHLRVDGVSHAYADRPVLVDVSLLVPAGTPTGLLGENGAGKSTLLRLIAGREHPDAGSIDAPGPIGLLHQELPFAPRASVADVLADALARSRTLEDELERAAEALADGTAASARSYEQALERASVADVWNAPQRADEVLAGLGLAELDRAREIDHISGGQRERLALAHLLIARPTTLLLDEPTNHLDDAGAAYLARLLAEHPGPVLVASHDRAFLDEATQAQVDLDPAPRPLGAPGGATRYTGTFTDYLLARLDERERWEKRYRDEQEELARLRTVVRESHDLGRSSASRAEVKMARKFFADRNAARVSRHVRDAERRIETLEREQIRKPPAELHFSGLPSARATSTGGVLLAASSVAVAERLAPTSLALSAGEKLLITGPNGCGKSTLLAVLVGMLDPDAGTVQRPASLRIGLLAQDEATPGDAEARSVRDILLAAAGRGPEDRDSVPDLFGLVHPRDLDRPLAELSRGQRRRVELAAILTDPPELLVLDEPTNHLALDLATRLERELQDWPGTVLIASHDRWLRRRWRGEELALAAA